jgi:formylmethanofuran dehydrogenase subunit C
VTEQTRFKYGLVFVGIVFVEGMVKAFLPGFPFVEAIAAQGAAVGVYTVAKTANNESKVKASVASVTPEPK